MSAPLRDDAERTAIALAESLMRLIGNAEIRPEILTLIRSELEPFYHSGDSSQPLYKATLDYLTCLQATLGVPEIRCMCGSTSSERMDLGDGLPRCVHCGCH
jgi:hypothetical protein